jgi:TonB family protein
MGRTFLLGLAGIVLTQPHVAFSQSPQNAIQRGGSVSGEDYPFKMVREQKSGSVISNFRVNEFGRVDDCKALISSGYKELDEVSCELITRRFRFRPARDNMGKVVSETINYQINWDLTTNPIKISSRDILSSATGRCLFMGFVVLTKEYRKCLSEQIGLLGKLDAAEKIGRR